MSNGRPLAACLESWTKSSIVMARQAATARAAAELRLTTRQVYNLLARYRADRTATALPPRAAVSRRKRLPQQIEDIIDATLREEWLTLEAPPLTPVVAEIQARCEEAGLAMPSYVTVARRIPALFSPEEIAKKRSSNPKHLLRLKPRTGYIHAPPRRRWPRAFGIAFDILRGREPDAHAAENRTRLKLHVWTIVAFLLGGILGVIAYRQVGGYLLLVCAGLLFAISLSGIRHGRGTFATTATRRLRWLPQRRQ